MVGAEVACPGGGRILPDRRSREAEVIQAHQFGLNAQRAELTLATQPEDQLLVLGGDFAVG